MDDTKTCPYCAETIRAEAIKCRYCRSRLTGRSWTRSRDERLIAGVCGGLAEEFNVPVTVVRLAFVLGFLFGLGSLLIVYIVLWIIMPLENDSFPDFGDDPFPGERERGRW